MGAVRVNGDFSCGRSCKSRPTAMSPASPEARSAESERAWWTLVMAAASIRSDTVYTSDVDDLERLLELFPGAGSNRCEGPPIPSSGTAHITSDGERRGSGEKTDAKAARPDDTDHLCGRVFRVRADLPGARR